MNPHTINNHKNCVANGKGKIRKTNSMKGQTKKLYPKLEIKVYSVKNRLSSHAKYYERENEKEKRKNNQRNNVISWEYKDIVQTCDAIMVGSLKGTSNAPNYQTKKLH